MSLRKLVKEELSGENAKSYVARICQFHRIQASPMFHEAAQYVKAELLKLGLKDALIEQFVADGKKKYWTYTSPIGWEVKHAELRLVEPKPEKLLCTYQDHPQCLHTYSSATPPEGVTAELVDVESGLKPRDYSGKAVKGKFVLATGRAKLVHKQAVNKYGAAGVITDTPIEIPDVREAVDIPDACAYQGIWPTADDLQRSKFGFSISKRQGNQMRSLLQAGKTVSLKASVNSKLFPFYEDVVTCTIKGSKKPEEEIFLIAHLCHPKPSANDNASGAGLLLEIARTIQTLMSRHRINRPARTIRFFWVPETLGTVAYLSNHPETRKNLVAGINLDMVGQDQELCKSTLNLDRTPDSCPSYLNDYVFSLIEETLEEFDPATQFGSASVFRYRMNSFSGGSDHAEFNNSTIGVPCVMLLQWPDIYYHSSMDTIDKVDEVMLKRIGWVATLAALSLANATPREGLMIACLTALKGKMRVIESNIEATRHLLSVFESLLCREDKTTTSEELSETAGRYTAKIEHIIWRESRAVKSVTRLGNNPRLAKFITRCCEDIEEEGKFELARLRSLLDYIAEALPVKIEIGTETPSKRELKRLVPKRLFRGTLNADHFKNLLGEKRYEWYEEIIKEDESFNKKMAEIINFMNGVRTAHEIVKAVSAEYSPTNPEHSLRFLKDLNEVKLAILKRTR